MGKKSSPPKPPDYKAAAEAEATANRDLNQMQTFSNRPDLYTPWGSQTWQQQPVWDPTTQQYVTNWMSQVNLSPMEQAAFDSQQRVKVGRSELAEGMLGRMYEEFGQPMDWTMSNEFGDRAEAGDLQTSVGAPAEEMRARQEDAIFGKLSNRLDDRFGRQRADLEAQLMNQGVRPGDAAYDRAMAEFGETENDAYENAAWQSIMGGGSEAQRDLQMDVSRGTFGNQALQNQLGMDVQAGGYNTTLRQQEIAELMQQRGFSLNEINALLYGQQVGMPQMPGFNTANKSQGPSYLNAADMQHQADTDAWAAGQGQDQAMMGGIADAAGMMAMFSDRRVKRNIERIGATAGGTPLYRWEYIWGGEGIGVMSEDVPHAVIKLPTGIEMVDYSKVT